ncbi:hypothetical protein A2Y85_01430 [candidate division WOR-3 bacterium RBG_13_43_14]|uniref:PAS domain-containing protein n=1 Tax=candidate division WOR-3 bacterium RBG_13_43_14 TaxID=1802590 RepID=A0A1F4U6G0_UNCW3|nr:MAG: hypothetical protein A2Y85_01430 [candidate division WOR-3 bacterium RBG_13_43_14]
MLNIDQIFDAILKACNDAIFITNQKRKIVLVNPAAEKLFSLKRDKIIGRECHKILYGQKIPHKACPLQNMLKTKQKNFMEIYLDKHNKWLRWTIIPIFDPHGNIIYFLHDASDITKLKIQADIIKKERFKLLELFENLPLMAYSISRDGKILDCNVTAWRTLEYKNKAELLNKSLIKTIYPYSSRAKAKKLFKIWKKYGKIKNEELQVITKKGKILDVLLNVDTIYDHTGKSLYSISTQIDYTERKKLLENVKTALSEKETLLKEIHHRVKNNLQIISSLLNLQAVNINDPQIRRHLFDSQNRIKSMVLVHEKLYESEDLAHIQPREYFGTLAKFVYSFYGIKMSQIVLELDIDDILTEIDTAIPCGLIVNELLSNALKYAFPSDFAVKKPVIHITFRRVDNNKILFRISDNGIGLSESLDIKNTKTLGLQLVYALAKQLNGQVKLDRKHGTGITIIFKDTKEEKRN